jgi:phosphoribosylglycinamide formyltransferase-1
MGVKTIALGVLASGRGSNLQAILDACEAGTISAKVRIVVSDVAGAYALERARRHGVETRHVDPKAFPSRQAYDQAVMAVLRDAGADLICLAGFMRLLTPPFVAAFPNRIMNIHPALLPAFPGLHVQRKAVDHGVKVAGCTVHFVDEGTDTGPIIIQAAVPVYDDDTEATLAARILRQEHRIYPRAIQLFAEGRLEVQGRRVICRDASRAMEGAALVNPSSD